MKTALFSISVLLISLLLTACTPSPVKIGYMAALSGRLSQLGVASREALQIVTDNWNDAGGINGRRIEIIIADDESIPEQGERELLRLIDSDVVAVIGPLTSNMLPAIEKAAEHNQLIISPTISTAALERRDDHFLRLMPATSEQGRILHRLMQEDDIRTAVVVYDISNAEYTEDVRSAFEPRFIDTEGEILKLFPYDSTADPDFASMAQEIVELQPQGVLLICSAIDAAAIAQQLWKREYSVELYGSRWTKTDDIIEYGGRAVEGMKMVSGYFGCDFTPAAIEFREEYKKRLGYEPGFAAVYTYEAVEILYRALEAQGSTDVSSVKEAIIDARYRIYCENIYIDHYGDTQREDAYTVIREGAFHTFKLEG